MIIAKFAAGALALALGAAPASAAVYSVAQAVYVGGDLALNSEFNEPIYLPAFDTSLGTLLSISVRITGELDWAQSYFSVADPGPLETISTSGSLGVSDENFNAIGPFEDRQGPAYKVPNTYDGLSGTIAGFDVDGVLPAADLLDYQQYLTLGLMATVVCTSCQIEYVDDMLGEFSGIETTTFQYSPASSIPAPPSWALLGVGLLGLGTVSRWRPIQN